MAKRLMLWCCCDAGNSMSSNDPTKKWGIGFSQWWIRNWWYRPKAYKRVISHITYSQQYILQMSMPCERRGTFRRVGYVGRRLLWVTTAMHVCLAISYWVEEKCTKLNQLNSRLREKSAHSASVRRSEAHYVCTVYCIPQSALLEAWRGPIKMHGMKRVATATKEFSVKMAL